MNEHAIEHAVGSAHPAEEAHPQAPTYIVVAIILTILTAFEIGVFYAPFLQVVLVPLLIILAILKFILVAAFYMHLHFDSRVFSALFIFPLGLATLIVLSLMLLFFALGEHLAL
ncbi:MAG: cytochrome C oxidase subunit IV family protein [Deltaproteobacteria bacterium]|nr:cytochrome C oxidase subunit IV family protein [Deltaproteobacteria bacterium]